MTPLNIFSKKLALFAVLLSLFTALVSVGCDSGSPSGTSGGSGAPNPAGIAPTAITNPTTGSEANPTAPPTGVGEIPSPLSTAEGGGSTSPGDNGTVAPGGVSTAEPAIGTATPPAQVTVTPPSNTNTNSNSN